MESLLLRLRKELYELENELDREKLPEITREDENFRSALRNFFLNNNYYLPMNEEKIAFIEKMLEPAEITSAMKEKILAKTGKQGNILNAFKVNHNKYRELPLFNPAVQAIFRKSNGKLNEDDREKFKKAIEEFRSELDEEE